MYFGELIYKLVLVNDGSCELDMYVTLQNSGFEVPWRQLLLKVLWESTAGAFLCKL